MDVKNMFLQRILDEEVYMNLPPDHKNASNPFLTYKLKKIIMD
jgi:hypothetical protein